MHGEQVEAVEVVEPGVHVTAPEDECRLVDVGHKELAAGRTKLTGANRELKEENLIFLHICFSTYLFFYIFVFLHICATFVCVLLCCRMRQEIS